MRNKKEKTHASRYHRRFSYLWHCPLSRPGKYYACGLSESSCSRSHLLLLNLLHLLILLHLLHWSSSPNSLHQTPTAPARSRAMLIIVNYHPQCRNSNSISEGWTLKAALRRRKIDRPPGPANSLCKICATFHNKRFLKPRIDASQKRAEALSTLSNRRRQTPWIDNEYQGY